MYALLKDGLPDFEKKKEFAFKTKAELSTYEVSV